MLCITQRAESGPPSTLPASALENDLVGCTGAAAAAVTWQHSSGRPLLCPSGRPGQGLSGRVTPRGSFSAAILCVPSVALQGSHLLRGLHSSSRKEPPPLCPFFSFHFPEKSEPFTAHCIISLIKILMNLRSLFVLLDVAKCPLLRNTAVSSSLNFHLH